VLITGLVELAKRARFMDVGLYNKLIGEKTGCLVCACDEREGYVMPSGEDVFHPDPRTAILAAIERLICDLIESLKEAGK
jgi:hypothetical protein